MEDKPTSTVGTLPAQPSLSCPGDRVVYLRHSNGTWGERCYPEALPRDTALWASDGRRVVALSPQRSGAQLVSGEDVGALAPLIEATLWVLEPDATLHKHALQLHPADLGVASSIALHQNKVFLVGGECCNRKRVQAQQIEFDLEAATIEPIYGEAQLQDRPLWPTMTSFGDRLLLHSYTFELPSEPLVEAGSFSFGTYEACHLLHPTPDWNDRLCTYRDSSRSEGAEALEFSNITRGMEGRSTPHMHHGRDLTFALQPEPMARLVSVGQLSPNAERGADALEFWPHTRVQPRVGPPRMAFDAPVVGDGVTLVWHAKRGQLVLIDPFGGHSFARQGEQWLALEQHPLPAIPDALRSNVSEASLAPRPDAERPVQRADRIRSDQVLRFTQHAWPYFAFYDTTEDAIAVVPYGAGHEFCVALDGHDGATACLKPHP